MFYLMPYLSKADALQSLQLIYIQESKDQYEEKKDQPNQGFVLKKCAQEFRLNHGFMKPYSIMAFNESIQSNIEKRYLLEENGLQILEISLLLVFL